MRVCVGLPDEDQRCARCPDSRCTRRTERSERGNEHDANSREPLEVRMIEVLRRPGRTNDHDLQLIPYGLQAQMFDDRPNRLIAVRGKNHGHACCRGITVEILRCFGHH